MEDVRPLDRELRVAGGIVARRGGRDVVVHYGSAAGELAVCIRAVGIVDRSDLAVLELSGEAGELDAALERIAGVRVAVGGLAEIAGAWCGRPTATTALATCRPDAIDDVAARLRSAAGTAVELRDVSALRAAIGLIGAAVPRVLAALGAYGAHGEPRAARPCATARLDELDVVWLLESDRSAFALVERSGAGRAWHAVEAVGRPFGLSCVGHDAAARFALLEHARARNASQRRT